MQQVLIKKFTLLRNGVEYKAGTILELPEAEANALVAGAPKEFEKVSVGVVVNSNTSAKKSRKNIERFYQHRTESFMRRKRLRSA